MTIHPSHDTRIYAVQGMTCSHCATSVGEEVLQIAGVEDVDLELSSGRMTVAGEDFSDEAVESAVLEAGYEVVS